MDIVTQLIQICFNLWLLFVLIFAYTMMITVYGKLGSKAANISAVITLIFYLLHFLSQLWDVLEFSKPFNVFSYYEPQKLMFNQGNFSLDILVLGSLIVVCFGISLKRFQNRDIP